MAGTQSKLQLNQPTLFLLYGFPGAGKTYFARQLSDDLNAAHVQADRIRHELFDEPRYDQQEDQIVAQLAQYMTEEFLGAGLSVVLDMNVGRVNQRRALREIARKNNTQTLIIWFQIDTESSFSRVVGRDRRKADDRYSRQFDRTTFDAFTAHMQNPTTTEDYVVLSGKHVYGTQRSIIIKRLYDMGLLQAQQTQSGLAKPELVNLVPNPLHGRVDPSRRNISIR